MPYETVFEISWQTFPWPVLIVGVTGFVLGAVVLAIRFSRGSRSGKIVGIALMIMGLLWCLNQVLDHHRLTRALATQQARVVEGPVSNYEFRMHDGHGFESFLVNGEGFHYSDFVPSGGYHQPASQGGMIREGLWVRLHYLGNTILRVEIAR
jgi:hypothetical protein